MSFFKKRNVKAVVIIAVCIVVLAAVTHLSGSNPVSNILKTVFVPVQHGFSYISYKIDTLKNFI